MLSLQSQHRVSESGWKYETSVGVAIPIAPTQGMATLMGAVRGVGLVGGSPGLFSTQWTKRSPPCVAAP